MRWGRARFKGKGVWVALDEAGRPRVEGGRVPMRYQDSEGARIYRASASRVALDPEGEVRVLPAGKPADGPTKPGAAKQGTRRGSGFGRAGSRTAAQAAGAARAADELLRSLDPETTVAFTDGASRGNPGPAGSGVHLRLPDGRVLEASRSLGTATNNIAELDAVGLAFELLDRAGIPPEAPVALLTDSSYVHGVLCKGWKAKANAPLIAELKEALRGRPGLVFHWIAGHAGITGNERADALANAGVEGRTEFREERTG